MEICNVVSSFKIPVSVDIKHICKELRPIASRKSSFPAVNLKLYTADLCQIFSNGKMIIIGGRSVAQNYALFEDYVQLLHYLGYDFPAQQPQVQNIIAKCSHSTRINLLKFAAVRDVKDIISYEPEVFPAIRYRLDGLKITINIFHTGKCMVLGAKSTADLIKAQASLRKLLQAVPPFRGKDGSYGQNCH